MRFMSKAALLSATVITGCGSLPRAVEAQEASAQPDASPSQDADTSGLEDIVVTARKRAESVQTVPIAILAVSGETLAQNQVRTSADLTALVPALRVVPVTNNPADARLTLRGQTPIGSLSIINDQPVSLYIDGIYYARTQGVLGSLVDVSAVEVAKGPQGTLIGRNSTGGAVLIRTNRPKQDLGASARVVYGSYGRLDADAVVNVPLGAGFAVRAVVSSLSADGYLHNVLPQNAAVVDAFHPLPSFPGGGYRLKDGREFESNSQLYRVSLLYQSDDDFSALLSYTHRKENGSGTKQRVIGFRDQPASTWSAQPTISRAFTDIEGSIFPVGTLAAFLDRQSRAGFLDVETNGTASSSGKFDVASLELNKRLGTVDLKWVSSRQSFDQDAFERTTLGPIAQQITYFPAKGYVAYQSELTGNSDLRFFGQKLSLTGGLFFFNESNKLDGVITYATTSTGPSTANPVLSTYSGKNTSYAIYGQSVYNLTDRLRFTFGGRYSIDERQLRQNNQTALGCSLRASDTSTTPLNPCFRQSNADFRRFTYTLALDYRFHGGLIYATTRTGYKSGGLNGFANTPGALLFKPERVQDYEFGIKTQGRLGRIPFRANVAAFYTDLRDQQQQLTIVNVGASPACVPGTATYPLQCGAPQGIVILNSKKSRIKGLEFDLEAKPVESLSLSFNGAYTDGKFVSYQLTTPPGFVLQPGTAGSLDGRPFNGPRWSLTGAFQYTLPLDRLLGSSIGDISLRGDFSYSSKPQFSSATTDPIVIANSPAVTLVNFRLAASNVAGTGLGIAGFVRNAFNRHYLTSVSGPAVGVSGIFTGFIAEPRVFGIEASLRLGSEKR